MKTYYATIMLELFLLFFISIGDEVKGDTKPQSHPSQQASLKPPTTELKLTTPLKKQKQKP